MAKLVWDRIGDPDNAIEPFCGSCAWLLARPHPPRIETVNDADAMIANFWRATQFAPDEVAEWADWPVSEVDLHAIHRWLVLGEEAAAFRKRMREDPDYFDAKRAGRWVFGACCWIGSGWCQTPESAEWDQRPGIGVGQAFGNGVHAQSQQVPRAVGGRNGAPGVTGGPSELHQKRPALGNERGVFNELSGGNRPQLADAYSRGRGVHNDNHLSEKRPHLGTGAKDGEGGGVDAGNGVHRPTGGGTCAQRRAWLVEWFSRLRDRLRTVRVCCGHWLRVCDSESVTTRLGVTGVFLDPPYPSHAADGTESRTAGLYATDGSKDALDALRDEVLAWCKERGPDPKMRIVVAGYDADGYKALCRHGWEEIAWKASGGYGNRTKKGKANAGRERLWVSPHCVKAAQPSLFDAIPEDA